MDYDAVCTRVHLSDVHVYSLPSLVANNRHGVAPLHKAFSTHGLTVRYYGAGRDTFHVPSKYDFWRVDFATWYLELFSHPGILTREKLRNCSG
jgi:hypothetical protein